MAYQGTRGDTRFSKRARSGAPTLLAEWAVTPLSVQAEDVEDEGHPPLTGPMQ